MTITSTQNRVSYAGNGAPGVPGTLAFAVPFRFLAIGDLVVLVRVDATGVSTTMTLDTNYSVAGEGAATGGTVTFLIEDGEPQTGETLIIYGNPAMTQLVDYISGGTFPAESHEEALDRLTLQSTRTREIAERALPLTDSSTDGSGQYNANGNRISSLGTPTATTDATTKTYVDVLVNNTALGPAPTGLIATGSITSRLLADRWGEVKNVKDFGAVGDGVADDTAAVLAAVTAGVEVYFPVGTYKIGAVAVPDGRRLYGDATLKNSGTQSMIALGSDCTIDGLTIDGTASLAPHWGVSAQNEDEVTIIRCKFINHRIYCRNSEAVAHYNLRVSDCLFTDDFSSWDYVSSQLDALAVYGVNGVTITNNTFRVTNVHRVMKISDNTTVVSPTISNFSSRYVVVSGNIITGSTTSDKQVLDMYLGAGDFAFVNNVVDVTGFGVVVEDKTEFNAPANGTNARRSLVVDGNVITADCAAVQLQGSFGITQATFLDNRRGSAVVSNNIITHTNTDSEAMSLRFLNSAIVSDNVVNSPDAGASPAGCVILSNESAIVTGNKFHSGFASITIATTNHTGHTFSGLCKSVILAGNTFTDFDASAAVVVSGIDSSECSVSVTGNVARTGRAVSLTSRFFKGDLSNIGHFAMTGNSYETDINNAATPILLGTWLTKSDTTTGNSWQLRVTDLSTGPPTSGRWWRGDIARTNNPVVDVASSWTCITTGSFSSATDATGDTDGSTAVITGLADTSDFFVNDWVALSAGMASAGTRSRIIAKTSTTVTLDTASTSAQSNVTLATVDPVFSVSSVAGAVVSAADVPLFGVTTLANETTPTVLNGKYFLTGGTTTIEDFDDGVVGQTITVKAKHSLQITDGGDLELVGNFAMTTGDTITLTMIETGKWSEISRSDIA